MAKPNISDTQTTPLPAAAAALVWGTWEELLLASAVNRHGTACWDSVAAELRKRSFTSSSLTPLSCKLKFQDLRLRFSNSPHDQADSTIPFLDDLRRLRVDELRRELRRADLSIVSLESTVEKLKEEREMSLLSETKPDLETRSDEDRKPKVHDDRSENESNSSGLKTGGPITAVEEDPDPVAGDKPPDESLNGSSDTTAKGSAVAEEPEKLRGVGSCGSASDGTKEVCSREAGDRTVEDKAPLGDVESQPLVGFLDILRSHKSGSYFEPRLEIQETPSYNNMIRQHIDFEVIRIRLEEGCYSSCKSKFFRDLMLIFNNAIIYFGRKAPESMAANKLRLLVLKEMMAQSITITTAPKQQESLPKKETEEPESKPEQEKPSSVSLLRKPKISVPMNACRKRSSILSRSVSTSSSGQQEKKKEPIAATTTTTTSVLLDAKAESWKQSDQDTPALKTGRKDGLRTNTRSTSSNKKQSTSGTKNDDNSTSKSEKEKNNNSNSSGANNGGKKRSATNFLNRMKRASETSRDSESSRGSEKRKSKQKEHLTPSPPPRRASTGKQTKEPMEESPTKRNVGRPTKRSAAAAQSSAPPAKRSRHNGETEVITRPISKKRSRK